MKKLFREYLIFVILISIQLCKETSNLNFLQAENNNYFSCFIVNLQGQLSGRCQNQRDWHQLARHPE